MTGTRSQPDAGENPVRGATTGTSRWQRMIGILGVVVVLWVGNDTYEVIDGDFGGGAGQDPPAENQDQGTDTGGGHTPGGPAGGHR